MLPSIGICVFVWRKIHFFYITFEEVIEYQNIFRVLMQYFHHNPTYDGKVN